MTTMNVFSPGVPVKQVSPQHASGRPVSPRHASGRPVSPQHASGRPVSPQHASGRPVSPTRPPDILYGPQGQRSNGKF